MIASTYQITLTGVMYHDECKAFVLTLYDQVEGILLYYDFSRCGHRGPNYQMMHSNNDANHPVTQADHQWPNVHAEGDAKSAFYKVANGVFMFRLTRPVANLVMLVYKDEQIAAIKVLKEQPVMHLGIGPVQASRSEMSAFAEPPTELVHEQYTSGQDEELHPEEDETTQVTPPVAIKVEKPN